MTTLVQVVYPQVPAASGTAQLNVGPYFVPAVHRFLRLELHGKENFQGALFGPSSVETNSELYSVQWVPHGSPPADCVTTADGPQWFIRRQIGSQETRFAWDATSTNANVLITTVLEGCWAGQLAINADIDIYLSIKPPSGLTVGNRNLFASMRWWWV